LFSRSPTAKPEFTSALARDMSLSEGLDVSEVKVVQIDL
jgi:hypothetical protein